MTEANLSDELRPGQRLLWYKIDKVIGRGAFGITYLAEDVNLHRPVAIKEFFPTQYCTRTSDATTVQPMSESTTPRFRWAMQRFMSEARTLARFEHPNIIRVNNVFAKNGTAYMVMNYESGMSLSDWIKRRGNIDETGLLQLLEPLLDGLEKIHAAGFIHRDIKPTNIYMRDDGMPVLIDFGSARQALNEQNESLTNMVSPGYAPIEQYTRHGGQQGPWTDIYALAATLYRLLIGKAPPSAIDRCEAISQGYADDQHKAGSGDDLQALLAGHDDRYSASFLQAVAYGMAFRHHDRPQSVAVWRTAFGLDRAAAVDTPGRHDIAEDKHATTQPTENVYTSAVDDDVTTATGRGVEGDKTSQMRFILDRSSSESSDDEQTQLYAVESSAPAAETSTPEASTTDEQPVTTHTSATDDDALTLSMPAADRHTADQDIEELSAMRHTAFDPANNDSWPLPRISPVDSDEAPTAEAVAAAPAVPRRRRGLVYVAVTASLCLTLAAVLAAMINSGIISDTLNRLDSMADLAVTDMAPMMPEPEPAETRQDDTAPVPNDNRVAQLDDNDNAADMTLPLLPVDDAAFGQAQQAGDIRRLLAAADKDVSARRLTTPENDNAYEKYQRVLQLDPGNEQALAGLQNIFNVYLMIAEQSLEQGRYTHAEKMLARAGRIDSDSARFQRTRLRIERQRDETTNDAAADTIRRQPLSPPLHY